MILPIIPSLNYNQNIDPIPNDNGCKALWDTYGMFDNIRRHSLLVANFAEALAVRAIEIGFLDYIESCRAGALLHDIAKSYTVQYGGNHAQLGASWVIFSTGNCMLAQIVLNHVEWLWELPSCLVHPLFIVLYADKRVQHDQVVTLDERYIDILVRYGKTKQSQSAIYRAWEHVVIIERLLSAQLEIPLHECTLIGRRLVHRA